MQGVGGAVVLYQQGKALICAAVRGVYEHHGNDGGVGGALDGVYSAWDGRGYGYAIDIAFGSS